MQDALAATLQTRTAHFYSRSRGRQWQKGEESGNILDVHSIATDCDQDVLLLHVKVRGAGVACHTGARSCFYRSAVLDSDIAASPLNLERSEPTAK